VLHEVDVLPVVEARTADSLLVGPEAQGVDQMEAGTDAESEAADVARVRSDLRLDERDVELGRHAQASAVSGSA